MFAAVFLLIGLFRVQGQDAPPLDPKALVQKIQGELAGPFPLEDGKVNPAVPHGEFIQLTIQDSKVYPGAAHGVVVYVPAQYDPAKPACLWLKLDGMAAYEGTVMDNLIAQKAIPMMIGVGLYPGVVVVGSDPNRRAARFNRSYENDSMNDHFADFVLTEILPAVQQLKTHGGRGINLSPDGNDHLVSGISSGGICAFSLAWQRPDQFTRVYSICGTLVSMRGGNEYPALIRKTDPKPLRLFLEDGSNDAWNPLFGSWYDANQNTESALSFSGYDVAHAWGTHGHDGTAGNGVLPDVMRWLWRDYPAPIKPGISNNSTLQEITLPGEGWQKIPQTFQQATGLAANAKGEVYLADSAKSAEPGGSGIFHLGADDKPVPFVPFVVGIAGQAFGPDGSLYTVLPEQKKIIAFDPQAKMRTVADGIGGRGIIVTHDGTVYVTEPGEHSDTASHIWRISPNGDKKIIDQGLSSASGLAFSPDGSLFFAAENTTKWIYSYVVQPDGSLADKQPYYWLHMTDIPNDSGAEDLAVDTHGELYAATRMGVQVCDQNGRVRAILPLPTPCGPVRSLCFGGAHFDYLYVTDGIQVFKRHLKVPGIAPWAPPFAYPKQDQA